MKKFIITVDVEKDISKYLKNSYKGIEEGLPCLLDILDEFKIISDFFITANACKKYPTIINRIIDEGHNIGCHSYDHSILYGAKSYKKQYKDLTKATSEIEKITGKRLEMFRAPNFCINGDTIKALERLDYSVDSSILPGRLAKKWRLFTICNYRNAPKTPYRLSYTDVKERGESSIVEVPLTENPLIKGVPIGTGYLNYFGYEKAVETLDKIENVYTIFLIHPWELVDLGSYYPHLREWLHKSCSSDLEPLKRLLKYVRKNYTFSTIEEIVKNE